MLTAAHSPSQILLPKNNPTQDEEIAELQQRIKELEDELMRVYQELIHERQHAYSDQLTGIPNRRAFQSRLQEERLRSIRNGKSMCLLIWDIDHFKSINDRHGHQMGDKVLTCVAQKITQRLRGSDFTARFGGEEFVSLLPDCDITNALHLAEQLLAEISCCDQITEQEPINVTLSCGVAEFQPQESARELFARADAALYQAKRKGRNRACLADSNQF